MDCLRKRKPVTVNLAPPLVITGQDRRSLLVSIMENMHDKYAASVSSLTLGQDEILSALAAGAPYMAKGNN